MHQPHDGSVRILATGAATSSITHSIALARKELYATRDVMWRLFYRDAVGQARQKLLGHSWAVIHPVMGMVGFMLLSGVGVLNPGVMDLPYPVYLYFSMSLWMLFVGAVTTVGGGLLSQGELALRTSVPKITLALSGLPNFIYVQLINGVIFYALMITLGVTPSWGALALPVLVIPLLSLGIGVGLILSVFSALTRDMTGVITSILNLLMYFTPVIYTQRLFHPYFQLIVDYNPLTYLIASPRDLFFHGIVSCPLEFLFASAMGLMTLAWGIHAFYLIQDKVVERL